MQASTGSLDILVNEKEEFTFTYTKVADYKDGEYILKEPYQDCGINLNDFFQNAGIRKATEILATYESEKIHVKTHNKIAHIESLTEGVYLIEGCCLSWKQRSCRTITDDNQACNRSLQ